MAHRQLSMWGGLAAAMLVVAGAVVGLHAETLEETYIRYHRAVAAAEQCGEVKFGTPENTRFAAYIDGKVDNQIGAGKRLQLIEQAKSEVGALVEKEGCGDPQVAQMLDLYDTELAPLLR